MKRPIAAVLSVTIALAGCSTASKNITANYVSPTQYQSYDCEQIASETQRIQVRVNQLGDRLDTAASHDVSIGIVGAILFWPALFALGGTKAEEAEYARLKGEYDAVQQSAVVKKCSFAVAPTPSIGSAMATDMPELAKKSKCDACHQIDKKIVGPSWRSVSARYRDDASAEARLINKVANGGGGVWGEMPEPAASPRVSHDDIQALVKFVLALR